MARKNKGVAVTLGAPEGEHTSTSIDSAENGFIVNVSGHRGGKNPNFFSKRYVAHSHPQAFRIAAAHHFGRLKAGGKKGSGKRKAGFGKE